MNVSPPNADASDVKSSALVDTIETAIDFVLALEHPCMPHIPSHADPPSTDPANHIMMASTPLVARSPYTPQLNQTWTASGAIIKELLNLSSSINLEGELTPVEAWHRLHQHPDFWRLDRQQIQKLKRELSTKVSCCGYVTIFLALVAITVISTV
jgi:valyl-tRNA synthetase